MRIFRTLGFAGPAALAAAFIFSSAGVSGQTAGTSSSSPSASSKPSSATAPKGNAENGKQLFVKFGCYECHGREGQGGSYTGPRLGPDVFPFALLSTYIRRPTGEMPPYTDKVVSDADLADIYAFLQSRPHPPSPDSLPLPR